MRVMATPDQPPVDVIPRGNEDRERYVLAAIRAGASGAQVARSLGISRERVRQIWTRATGEPIPVRDIDLDALLRKDEGDDEGTAA
jgi:hypothetical protein